MTAASTVSPARSQATVAPPSRSLVGPLALALVSAASFGLAGSFGRSLLDLGWSPAAVVITRVGGAFLLLAVPAALVLRRYGLPSRGQSGRIAAYGVVAVAGAQFCFFSAVQYLSVGTALLLEYLGPVLLVGWVWARTRQRPSTLTFVGAAVSLLGLALVLDVVHGVGDLSLPGVAWGLAAAVALAAYFQLSDTGDQPIHPLVLTAGGTGVGALALSAAALAGLLPFAVAGGSTALGGISVPWWLPATGLIVICAAFAYVSGIVAVRLLGSSKASFVGLTEVLFAVLFAFLLLGQTPSPIQLAGGLLVVVGIVLVQVRPASTAPVEAVTTS